MCTRALDLLFCNNTLRLSTTACHQHTSSIKIVEMAGDLHTAPILAMSSYCSLDGRSLMLSLELTLSIQRKLLFSKAWVHISWTISQWSQHLAVPLFEAASAAFNESSFESCNNFHLEPKWPRGAHQRQAPPLQSHRLHGAAHMQHTKLNQAQPSSHQPTPTPQAQCKPANKTTSPNCTGTGKDTSKMNTLCSSTISWYASWRQQRV